MLLNYLKLSFRLLTRNPFFTFINVAGLSVGFAVFIILWQYSQNELASDQFHRDWKRITKVVCHYKLATGVLSEEVDRVTLPPAVRNILQKEVPEIDDATRIIPQDQFLVANIPGHDDKILFSYVTNTQERRSFPEERVIYADPNLFHFFSIPLAYGSPEKVLLEPNSIAISSSVAVKYFGSDQPVGKTLYLNDSIPFQVAGVFLPLPRNTHLDFDIVLSTNRMSWRIINSLDRMQLTTHVYLKRQETASLLETERKVNQTFQQKIVPTIVGKLWLMPLEDVAFSSFGFVGKSKSKYFLVLLGILSVVVLVMAWTNYIILSVSANSKRAKELAARKAVGAKPSDLVKQFIIEGAVINTLSFLAAITIVQLVKHPIELIFDFYIPDWSSFPLSIILSLTLVLIGAVAITGGYPAMVTIRRTPVAIFGSNEHRKNSTGMTGVLTVIQYTFAVVLIVWIFSVSGQIEYVLHKDRGIRTSQVGVIDLPIYDKMAMERDLGPFLKTLSELSAVQDFAVSHTVAGDKRLRWNTVRKEPATPIFGVETNGGVDERFIPFYGVKLVAGRNFMSGNPADRRSIIISMKALKVLGFGGPVEALGSKILIEPRNWSTDKMVPAEIIGVIEDYVRVSFYSDHKGINDRGTILTYGDHLVEGNTAGRVSVLIPPEGINHTIEAIQQAYSEYFPGKIFNWYFLEDNFNRHYQNEKTSRNQILLFTFLAIGIACLGLLGMMTQKVIEKTKEIGIRKVLGAKMHQLGAVLVNTTIKQVCAAVAMGVPIAWYLTTEYLEKFSEQVALQWWNYALPVVGLMMIMFGTIAAVLWKAAGSNPVEALKYE